MRLASTKLARTRRSPRSVPVRPLKPGLESSQHRETPHADAFTRAAGRRDRGAVCPPRRRHGAAARSHPRVRRPRRLEQRLPLVRRLARLARGSRHGRRARARSRGACAGRLAAAAQALARGELSYAKVRALTRVATPATEERLLAVGRAGTAEHVERIVRGWRRVDRQAEAQEAKRRHDERALHVYQDVDGTVVIRGRLAPEAGAVLMQALTAARDVQRAKPATFDGQQRFRGNALVRAAAGGRPGAGRGDCAPPWDRSWHPGRALSGGRPCRCRRAGRC